MHTTRWFSLVCFLPIISVGVAFTPDVTKMVFASWNMDDSTHTSITRHGIKRAVKTYFQSMKGATKRSVKDWVPDAITENDGDGPCWLDTVPYNFAIEEIGVGNSLTDMEASLKDRTDYHFDAEKFNDSNNILLSKRSDAIKELAAGSPNKARIALGHALHTFQDFYAHSNWIEMNNTQPSKGLGTPAGIEIQVAGPGTPTCFACKQAIGECTDNLINTGQLTSGYYRGNLFGGADETVGENGTKVLKPVGAGKCSHGGPLDDAANVDPIGGINKDTSDTNASPHGKWHRQAADMATQATADFIIALRNEIGDQQFHSLLNVDQACSNRRRRSAGVRAQKIKLYTTAKNKFQNHPRAIHSLLASNHHVLVLSKYLKASNNQLYIPIDNTLEDIVIEISGADTRSKKSILITSPSNVKHRYNIQMSVGTVAYIRIEAPEIGLWQLETVGTTEPCEVHVFGVSAWDAIVSVLLLGQTRHARGQGLRPLMPDEPLRVGMTIYVRVLTPVKGADVPRLELHNADGRFIKEAPSPVNIRLEDDVITQLFEVVVPKEPFRFATQSNDNKGFNVSRLTKIVYHPVLEGASQPNLGPKYAHNGDVEKSVSLIEVSHIFSMDQLAALSIATFACLIFIIVLLIVISLKIAINRCRQRKPTPEYEGDV